MPWGVAAAVIAGGAAIHSANKQSDAAKDAAKIQAGSGEEALDFIRQDLDPFKQLGLSQIDSVQSLASDPNAQMDFIQNHPLFDSLMDQSRKDIFANQAARGKLGGTGTEELLQNRFLEQGNNLINQQLNRQMPLLNMGQASAAQSATQGSQLLQDMGNSGAAASIAAANAQAAGINNVAGAAGAFMANRPSSNSMTLAEQNAITKNLQTSYQNRGAS